MAGMIRATVLSVFVLSFGFACGAQAQLAGDLAPGAPIPMPPPPAPPPPRIEVPAVPKLDAAPKTNLTSPPRRSFGDRMTTCLEEADTLGLRPKDRAAYSRACANR